MANVKLLTPKILKWEGGFVNDPSDKGGATNKGVTLSTWRACGYDKDGDGDIDCDDIKLLSVDDATTVLKKYFWDRWKADGILNQSVANILVDWVWGSGKWGIVIPQRILYLKEDGIVGNNTLNAVNNIDPAKFHAQIKQAREKFFNDIVEKDESQERFIEGWLNRLNDFKYS